VVGCRRCIVLSKGGRPLNTGVLVTCPSGCTRWFPTISLLSYSQIPSNPLQTLSVSHSFLAVIPIIGISVSLPENPSSAGIFIEFEGKSVDTTWSNLLKFDSESLLDVFVVKHFANLLFFNKAPSNGPLATVIPRAGSTKLHMKTYGALKLLSWLSSTAKEWTRRMHITIVLLQIKKRSEESEGNSRDTQSKHNKKAYSFPSRYLQSPNYWYRKCENCYIYSQVKSSYHKKGGFLLCTCPSWESWVPASSDGFAQNKRC
jgi:hypothetical protein